MQLLYFSGLYLQFTQYDYFVHENESSVEVCAELFGIEEPIAAGVSVGVNTSDDTAIGKGGRREGEREGGRAGGKRKWEERDASIEKSNGYSERGRSENKGKK